MSHIDKIEQILFEALTEYSKNNKFVFSKIEYGSLSKQFERGCGLTLTLTDGKMIDVLISDTAD